jgi:Ca2+-transporting ATPase
MDTARAITVSFLTLAFAQLWHVFNMRDAQSGLIANDVVGNRYVWASLALCAVLLLGAVYTPFLAGVLKVSRPGAMGWGIVLAMSLLPLMGGQAQKLLSSRR